MSKSKDTDRMSQLDVARSAMEKIRDDAYFPWDEREALLLGRLMDSEGKTSKSRVNTQELANIVFDGASRVMAQFPTGKVFPTSKEHQGAASMLNLMLEKYFIPNANSQFSLLTKLRLWNVYSRVYGSMPALVDRVVSKSYVGPDIWLINPRRFFPQAGAATLEEAQYAFLEVPVSVEFLKTRIPSKLWNTKNLRKLIELASNGTPYRANDNLTYSQNAYQTQNNETGKFASVTLVTQYFRDKWVTFAPEFDGLVVREIGNPHRNGKLPIVMKECYPLLDRIMGLAEFERGKTLQYATNSLVNLYLDGVKFSIFPPTISTRNGVVKESMTFTPGSHWEEIIPNSIRQLELSPQGINTFTETYGFLKASMLSMAATTDTSVSKSTDPGFGKTPEALRQQASREGARDSWDRHMMEQALSEMITRWVDISVATDAAKVSVSLFGKELEEFKAKYPQEEFEEFGGSGKLGEPAEVGTKEVDYAKIKGSFKYIMDPGTSMKKDEAVENESLRDLIMLTVRIPGGLEQISKTGKINLGDKEFDFGEALKRFVTTSGIQDGNKIVRDAMPIERMIPGGLGGLNVPGQGPASPAVPGAGMEAPSMGGTGTPNQSGEQLQKIASQITM